MKRIERINKTTIKKNTIIKIDGFPYKVLEDTIVEGLDRVSESAKDCELSIFRKQGTEL